MSLSETRTSAKYLETIDLIRATYREMRFMEDQRKRADAAFMAYVRTQCGYSTHLPAAERDVTLKRAKALIAGTAAEDSLAPRVEWIRAGNEAAFARFRQMEKEKELEMKKLVRSLPIWTDWAKEVRGVAEKGVGILIGEGGDPGAYLKGESGLRKRMGIAVVDGIAQGKLLKTASKDDWIRHGYNKKRRSAMYTIGDGLVKQGDHFRAVYLARKEHERQRFRGMGYTVKPAAEIKASEKSTCISDGHVHFRAQRFMEQRLLRAYYRAWMRLMVPQTVSAPALEVAA
jgi:hypothetical protein